MNNYFFTSIIFLFIGINLVQGQKIDLPESIILTHRYSGASRQSGTVQFYSYKDSIKINRKSKSHFYQAEEYYSRNQKINPNRKVIYDSLFTHKTNLNINENLVEELLNLLDTSLYKSTTVILPISDLDPSDTTNNYFRGPFIPNDFSSKYFFNSSTITSMDDSLYIDNIIKSNLGLKVISSHRVFLSITIRFNDRQIKLFQRYPGGANFKWYIEIPESKIGIALLNPKINDIIYKMIPSEVKWEHELLEYKEHEDLFEIIRN